MKLMNLGMPSIVKILTTVMVTVLLSSCVNNPGSTKNIEKQGNSLVVNILSTRVELDSFGGIISALAPNGKSGEIGLINTGDMSGVEKLTFNVSDAKKTKQIHLEFQIDDTNIVDTNLSYNDDGASCDIESISTIGTGNCDVYLMPKNAGNTKISVSNGSFWIDQEGLRHSYDTSNITPVDIRVGSLFVGYSNNTIKTAYASAEFGLRSAAVVKLVMDEVKHKLYAFNGEDIWGLENTNRPIDIMSMHALFRLNNSWQGERGATFSGLDSATQFLIGTNFGNVYRINAVDGSVLDRYTAESSLIDANSANDGASVLFSDVTGRVYSFIQDGLHHDTFDYQYQFAGFHDLKAMIFQDGLIISGAKDGATGSTIKFIDDSKAQSTNVTASPFSNRFVTVMKLAPDSQAIYFGANDGTLYKLSGEVFNGDRNWEAMNAGKSLAMQSRCIMDKSFDPNHAIQGKCAIRDIEFDANGNLYATSGDSGVWKIYRETNKALYLPYFQNTSSAAVVLAIDNNAANPLAESGGVVVAHGPQGKLGDLALIYTNESADVDMVNLSLEVKGAINAKSAHLVVKIKNDGVLSFLNASKTMSCDIAYLESGIGSCVVGVVPKKVAKTTITITKDSYWIGKSKTKHNYVTESLINAHVGTLYAGYQNGEILAYGKSLTISRNKYGVSGLKVDEQRHTLYILSDSSIYKHQGFELESSNLSMIFTIPDAGLGSTMAYMGDYNELLFGTDSGILYTINAVNGDMVSQYSLAGYITSLNENIYTPGTYFIADATGQVYEYSRNSESSPTAFGSFEEDNSLQVVSSKYGLFAAGNSYLGNAGDVFLWNNREHIFTKIITDNESPFKNKPIGYMFTFPDGNTIYVTGVDGTISEIQAIEGNSSIYHWKEFNNGKPISDDFSSKKCMVRTNKRPDVIHKTKDVICNYMSDAAFDANGNLYIAAQDSGIWKLNATSAHKVSSYSPPSSVVNVVAIDNNF